MFPVFKGKNDVVVAVGDGGIALSGDGDVLESLVDGLPGGIGEPWFDSLESVLSRNLFAVPAVKGVEFGDGFAISELKGSAARDELAYEDGKIVTLTNHNGGINGGISNGMPLVIRTAVKPTPSISQPAQSVNLLTGENTEITPGGRHDPAIVHRARVVIDSVIAISLVDLCSLAYGTSWQRTEK